MAIGIVAIAHHNHQWRPSAMKSYFLGIDNGGTVSKAAIFDETGMQIAQASSSVRMLTPKAGHTERDMDELWHVTASVIRNAVGKSGIQAERIKGVACTGHGKGLYLWGKDGKPCGNGIISTDTRAWEYPVKWAMDGTADKVFAKTFQSILWTMNPSAWSRSNGYSK
ncbi:MAG: hypothetical protein CVV46_09015 [Spirochaetae bacterium HGW-Spirochaetae-2]|nr:MAG: hypothetical protein CVV46_09015 [Spirochaetae bacterium HGW-Spirochaetae-2]